MNRPVRTRTLGGVGGGGENPPAYPIGRLLHYFPFGVGGGFGVLKVGLLVGAAGRAPPLFTLTCVVPPPPLLWPLDMLVFLLEYKFPHRYNALVLRWIMNNCDGGN